VRDEIKPDTDSVRVTGSVRTKIGRWAAWTGVAKASISTKIVNRMTNAIAPYRTTLSISWAWLGIWLSTKFVASLEKGVALQQKKHVLVT
jgi:hypothetical protein